jgi:acyl-CoA thioesterase-2
MGDLAHDTRVEGADGRYRATLSRDWEIWGPNGGYVAVIALRAAGAATTLRRPASFSCQFLNVAEFGDVDLTVRTVRASKRVAALGVSMTQSERHILEALLWVIDDQMPGFEHLTTAIPPVAAPESLDSYDDLQPPGYPWYPFWTNVETRPVEWSEVRQPTAPIWRAWLRYRPRATFADPFVDAGRSLILLDTMMWPAACAPYPFPAPYVAPSIELSVQFHRAAPTCEWLLCDAQAPVATGGLIGCHSQVWSADGQLLATGTGQLLCRRNPMFGTS